MIFNTLACGQKRDILKKNTETHVALRGNFSRSVGAINLVKASKDSSPNLIKLKILLSYLYMENIHFSLIK